MINERAKLSRKTINFTPWGLLAPMVFILAFFGLFPFGYVLYLSLHKWNLFAKDSAITWTGLNNYRQLVFDADFLTSLGKGVQFAVIAVTIEMVLGFFLAQLLMQDFKGRGFFRTIHALPLTLAPISIGAVWRLMSLPGLGALAYFLNKIGINFNIGASSTQAFLAVVLMDIWHWTPFITLTFIAGLSALPKEPAESAMVDGANKFQIIRHITLPLLRPIILTVIFIRMMDALRVVEEVWMLTAGGPGNATRFAGLHIWRIVLPKADYGYGGAISVILLYIIIVLSWLLLTVIQSASKRVEG
jgi:multiple sugar transport system permease protein